MTSINDEYNREENEKRLQYLLTRKANATRPKVLERLSAAVERLDRHLNGGSKGKQAALF